MIITKTRAITRTLSGLREKTPNLFHQGGSSCFAPGTLVVTDKGDKPIEEIKAGDIVLSYNESTDRNEQREVTKTLSFKNIKRTIKVKLKNGETIIATEDHQFYYKGAWRSLRHLLSLLDGK